MTAVSDLDVFARVIDGQIVEYPVYRLHIVNRGHPVDWYTPVVESPKPELPPYSSYKQSLTVVGGTVVASYSVIPQSLNEVLRGLVVQSTEAVEPGLPSQATQPPLITDVPPDTIAKVYDMVGDYVMDKLSAWAKTRKYGSFSNLTDYRDSAIPKFQAEALRGIELRDTIWLTLIDYFTKVTTGQLPVPTSVSEIDALVPLLLWPDEAAPFEAPEAPINFAPVAEQPVLPAAVHAPAILFPTDTASVGVTFTGVTTAFVSDDAGDSFSQLNWEASTDPDFASNVIAGSSTVDQTFEVTALVEGAGYFLRVAHVGAILGQSPWSTTTRFSVPAPVQEAPAA